MEIPVEILLLGKIMRKLNRGRKLSRERDQRRALLRSLAREFFLREKIKTTEAKAKELAMVAEKMITRAKADSLATKRLLLRDFSLKIVQKLIKEIAPRYKERKGGYTRVIKIGPRKEDGARMAIIELVK
jgi:large subunit ribosomal protein L17